MSKLTLLVST